MTIPGHRNYQFWNFSRPTLWASLEERGVPAVGLSYLLRNHSVLLQEPFRRLPLFESVKPPDDTVEETSQQRAEMVWSDPFTMVMNKPPAMKVHPNEEGERDTLWHEAQLVRRSEGWLQDRMRHIHRLDEATSGLVLFASCDYAHYVLDAMMRERMIHRNYVAWVDGVPPKLQGTIDAPIGRDKYHPTRRRVHHNGQQAITHYRLVDRMGRYSLLEMQLETGRTHQIRVHLQHLGCAIINDALYGAQLIPNMPMALCAKEIRFPHPWHGDEVHLTIETPITWRAMK